MVAEFTSCGLLAALNDVRAGELTTWTVYLFSDPPSDPGPTSCDEGAFTILPVSLAGQDPEPWGAVTTLPSDGITAYTDSAVMIFDVSGDPGSDVAYGWLAINDAEATGEKLRAYDFFDTPIAPLDGIPIIIVVRVLHRNCAE